MGHQVEHPVALHHALAGLHRNVVPLFHGDLGVHLQVGIHHHHVAILRVRTSCTPATPGVSSKVWRMACTSCSSTARSIRSCMASQPNSQPILPTMKPTISAAIGSRMG